MTVTFCSLISFDKICSLFSITPDEYILARNRLIEKDFIAFDGLLFQMLSLPEQAVSRPVQLLRSAEEMERRDPGGQAVNEMLIDIANPLY